MQEAKGKFIASLTRNNKDIKADRAEAIMEDAELVFKRAVEDISMELKRKRRDRENMLDLSGDSALSLKVASDFNAQAFTEKDLKLAVDIRNLEIKLELAQSRYNELVAGAVATEEGAQA